MKPKQTQPSETTESIALAKWLARTDLEFTHVPNGKHRTKIEGRHLKLMGVQAGFPDYLVFTPPRVIYRGTGCAVELKKREGGRASDEQLEWLPKLAALDWVGVVAEGCQQAVAWLAHVYAIPLPVALPFPILTTFVRAENLR